MDIGRTEGVQGPGRIEGTRIDKVHSDPVQPAPAAADRIEMSEVGHLVADAMALPEVRLDRIAELKAQIEAGTYQTEQRLLGALDKFLEECRG